MSGDHADSPENDDENSMDLTTWIVQNRLNLTCGLDTLGLLERACVENGRPFVTVSVAAGSDVLQTMPSIPRPFVFYGYTTLIRNASRLAYWQSGVFFDDELFRPSVYAERYGELYLNSDLRLTTIDELLSTSTSYASVFVRPDDDLKSWTGRVMTPGELAHWLEASEKEMRSPRIAVSSPKIITAEWRVFIVDGRAIAASQYQPQPSAWAPPEVEQFAELAASRWVPAPVVAMDIGLAEDGLKLIELNCFNGSSFYLADVGRIVRAVSRYMESGM